MASAEKFLLFPFPVGLFLDLAFPGLSGLAQSIPLLEATVCGLLHPRPAHTFSSIPHLGARAQGQGSVVLL